MEPENFFQQYETIIEGIAEKNYAVINGLFDQSTLSGLKRELMRMQHQDKLTQAGIGNQHQLVQQRSIRSDKIHWIENEPELEAEKAFMRRIADFSNYLNRTCYVGIRDWEFHYACFEKGNFYKRHLDRFRNDERRKFSVVTYLNEEWTEADGGTLVLYPDGREIRVLPEWGTTVVFKSDLLEHEVLPANRARYSVTGWLK